MLRIAALLVLLLSAFTSGIADAAKVIVTVGELDSAINNLDQNPDAIERMALEAIEKALNDADLRFGEGDFVFSDTSEDLIDDNSCNRTEIRRMNTRAVLASDTSLAFALETLNEPIQIELEIAARINVDGRAKQTLGFRLGKCRELAVDNFSFVASGDLDLSLSLQLVLNPTLDPSKRSLQLKPKIMLTGAMQLRNVRVNVDDSALRSVLETLIEDEIDDGLDASQLVRSLSRLETELQSSLDKQTEQGILMIELPAPDDEQVSRLYTQLSPTGDFSLSLGFLRTKRVELLAALMMGDDSAVSELISDAAQCEAAGLLQTNLPHPVVYQIGGDGCVSAALATVGTGESGLYKDPQCQMAFDYQSNSTNDYCNYVLDSERLGNAAANPETLGSWTLSPGTRFDIGALPLTGLVQPFTQRIKYKQVTTLQGECSLEMRVHTLQPEAIGSSTLGTNSAVESAPTLRPLIAFHGGSWQRRSSGALGIEAVATQFANSGYVVFAPFYRLIGTDEGNAACNGATLSELIDDAHDALDWVQLNAKDYGAEGKPVLFGQSAGGHLSGVLAVERPNEIASAVLFYSPTDFADFANQIVSGQVNSVTGQRILETVVDQTLDTLDFNAPLVRRNTLTTRIVDNAINTPPFFLLQGMEDTVLPFSQSVRLCDSLSGNPDAGSAANAVNATSIDPLRRVVNCGFDGSELHLITEGEHALDLCVAKELCLSGSPDSAKKTADSVRRMLSWLGEVRVASYVTPVASDPVTSDPATTTLISEIGSESDDSFSDQMIQGVGDDSSSDQAVNDASALNQNATTAVADSSSTNSGSIGFSALMMMCLWLGFLNPALRRLESGS